MGSINSILQGDAFKFGIIFFFIGSLIMMLFTELRKVFTKNKKKAILYAIVVLISFALVGLLNSSKVLNDTPLNSFIGFQFLFLLLGGVHVYALRTFFKDLSEDKQKFFPEFLFTVAITCIGLISFFYITIRFREPYKFLFLISSIVFLVPFLFYRLYEFALSIPVPVYKKWLYPLGDNIKDPTAKELKDPLVISFEFQKKQDNNDITNFRVKAPEEMEFGKLFYFFINDYNERHPESTIEFLNNSTNEPLGWIFYFKPNWWSGLQHINFAKTVSGNSIKEDHVIVCKRVDNT